jgi:lysophospholipase L1-like esterase
MNKVFLFSLLLITACRQNERLEKDWAYCKRYAPENARLSAPAPGENRIVFMGNSITEAWSYTDPDFFRNRAYINRGIGGQTTSQMIVRFRQDVIELRPKIVVILAGTNDIAQNTGPVTVEQIAGNIFSMAELARVNGIEPVICSVLPVKEYYWRKRIDPVPLINRLNELVSSYCTKNSIAYIDYHTLLADKDHGLDRKYTSDGVHPNREGYKRMDTLTEKAIAMALQNKNR